jgi:hypothetical protein
MLPLSLIFFVWNKVIPNIQNLKEPKEIWDDLVNLYEIKASSRRISIRNKLSNLKMEQDNPVENFME